jgi:hypothetical protein
LFYLANGRSLTGEYGKAWTLLAFAFRLPVLARSGEAIGAMNFTAAQGRLAG